MSFLTWIRQEWEHVMGDMADMVNDRDVDVPIHRRQKQSVECKFCGKDDLKWMAAGDSWRLYDSKDRIHTCRSQPKKTCMYCDVGNLTWGEVDEKWVLHEEDGSPHQCWKEEWSKENDEVDKNGDWIPF